MAQNDMIVFDSFRLAIGNKEHDLNGDTFKFGLVDNTDVLDMVRDEADPRWGAGGSVNFATNEVGTGGGYIGVVTLLNNSWAEVGDVFTFKFDDPALIDQHAAGATDIYWMVVYNETAANNECVCVIDLGGAVSLVAGSLTVSFNVNGIYQVTG